MHTREARSPWDLNAGASRAAQSGPSLPPPLRRQAMDLSRHRGRVSPVCWFVTSQMHLGGEARVIDASSRCQIKSPPAAGICRACRARTIRLSRIWCSRWNGLWPCLRGSNAYGGNPNRCRWSLEVRLLIPGAASLLATRENDPRGGGKRIAFTCSRRHDAQREPRVHGRPASRQRAPQGDSCARALVCWCRQPALLVLGTW